LFDTLRFRADLRQMGDEVLLTLFKPFPLFRDFNRSPRDRALDLRFCETFSLKSYPEPQFFSVEDAKSAARVRYVFQPEVMQSEIT
jgi:hypothetical protein